MIDEEYELRVSDDPAVRRWRFEQLVELGVPDVVASELVQAHVDYHDVEQLLERDCPLELAVEIVR